MKRKRKYNVVNSQEDEDGFNLNPFNFFISNITNGNQHFMTAKNYKNSASGYIEFKMIATKKRKSLSNI